jgi:23S rRNA (cytidine1920-2'-O)/16S rRNA (cytidine1409-2'-O)-methyltransferase
MRLDKYLFNTGQTQSRNKAIELIQASSVMVNNIIVTKPSYDIKESDNVRVISEKQYVSRAALKLKTFLEHHPLQLTDVTALDIGSSTGGFTQVLLEEGVKEVTCVDVGDEQLHPILHNDRRVKLFENCDIRTFDPKTTYDLVVSDVSFISLHKILESVDKLSSSKIILLFKPQFEVGKEVKRDRNGVVQDDRAIEESRQQFEEACQQLKWNIVVTKESNIKGKNGNIEFLYYFTK